MSTVSASMMRGLRTVAEAVFADEAGPPPGPRLDWAMAELEDFLAHAGGRARLVLRLALFAVLVVAPLFVAALPGLGRLPVLKRVEALARMEASFASAPVLAVKAFLCVIYYEHPDVQREVGYLGFGAEGRL